MGAKHRSAGLRGPIRGHGPASPRGAGAGRWFRANGPMWKRHRMTEAMASARVMSTCMAMGEAAGRAARIALSEGVPVAKVNVAEVRKELKETGAYLRD